MNIDQGMEGRALNRFCAIWGRSLPVWKDSQIGGGRVLFNGHPINIKEDVTGTFIMIHGGTKSGGRPCFIVEIDTDRKNAVLLDLEAGRWGDTCFTDNYQDSTALVKVATWIAKSHGAKTIELTDNSVVKCKSSGEKIDLAELSFITTGQTWYERLIPGLRPEDKRIAARLEARRRVVNDKKWADIVSFLPELIGVGKPSELAKDVLTRIKKNGKYCEFFANNMDTLRRAFGIESRIKGTHWVATL